MSYRTYVNDTQIFGNHEHYPEWINYIKSKGIEVGENDSYKFVAKNPQACLWDESHT